MKFISLRRGRSSAVSCPNDNLKGFQGHRSYKARAYAKYTKTFLLLSLIVLSVTSISVSGCGGPHKINWENSNNDVVLPEAVLSDTIKANVYLDATTSMKGFSLNGSGVYGKFLEELESAVLFGWKKAELHYFKFGTNIKEIDKDSRYKAANSDSFYCETGICEKTNIDAAISKMDSSQVNIVITDLFQDEGDINTVVQQIKEKCFAKGIYVGILGVRSDYDGMVYDAKVPAFGFKSTPGKPDTYRPFYALIFGSPANIGHLYDTLKSKYSNFVMISPYIVKKFDVVLTKSPSFKELKSKDKGGDNQFNFLLKEATAGDILAEVTFDRDDRAPMFNPGRMELTALKKVAAKGQEASANGDPTQDLTLKQVSVAGNTLKATIGLNLPDGEGNYSYLANIMPSGIDGFSTPKWVQDFSSANPTATSDSNKTLNFDKFVADLLRANSTVRQPVLARFILNVKKQ